MIETKRRALTCCCCGEDAGVWQQHWNRDTGFGLCPRCVNSPRLRESWMEPGDFEDCYGLPGVNTAHPTTEERS